MTSAWGAGNEPHMSARLKGNELPAVGQPGGANRGGGQVGELSGHGIKGGEAPPGPTFNSVLSSSSNFMLLGR